MKRSATAALAVAILLVAGCGDDDSAATTTTTTEAQETTTTAPVKTVEVRVVAELSGMGSCSASTERAGGGIGNGDRLSIEDQDGSTLGLGTMQLTRGADSCDWTAGISGVPTDADFYRIVAGDVLITLSAGELSSNGWRAALYVSPDGSVELATEE